MLNPAPFGVTGAQLVFGSRIVRQGGSVVIAWHGGTTPSRIARSLRLPEDELGRIEQVLRDHFGQVARRQLAMLDVFTATR